MIRRLNLPDSGAAAGADGLPFAPSAARNLAPIADVLAAHLPAGGCVLELASGTGQHVCAFAARFPDLDWQPSDADPVALRIIAARAALDPRPNLRTPRSLDACAPGWGAQAGPVDAVLLVNLLHLISVAQARCLLSEVASALGEGGVFCLYGPFRRNGALISAGDARFDASLRAQDPAIGYKDIDAVAALLAGQGLARQQLVEMPSANLMLIARRCKSGRA